MGKEALIHKASNEVGQREYFWDQKNLTLTEITDLWGTRRLPERPSLKMTRGIGFLPVSPPMFQVLANLPLRSRRILPGIAAMRP